MRPPAVDVLDVETIRLVETAAPAIPPDEHAAMDTVWDETVRANPSLFDGPAVACIGIDQDGPNGLVVTWARTTYRRYALRRVPGATACLRSLFVAVVQPTDDGRLLVGRMSTTTAAPGRWQLPGGSVEPPSGHDALTADGLRRHASRELLEETGIDTSHGDLRLWLLVRAEQNVGVLFRALTRPSALVHQQFAAVLAAQEATGQDPELDDIALVHPGGGLADLGGLQVDYLEPVLAKFTRGGH